MDEVTRYAEDVAERRIIAGAPVLHACRRHLRDLERKDITFSPERGGRAIAFLERLRLAEGQFREQFLRLLRWQVFVVGSVFGWLLEDGTRRFRRAYVEGGKGMGKTPLAAGIGLYGLLADGEPRAEVHIAASSEDQAEVAFGDVETFIYNSPDIKRRVELRKGRVTDRKYRGFIRTLAFKDTGRGISGLRPHIAVIDEYHEHKTAAMTDFLELGQKSRRQPLIFIITNSGENRNSPCFLEHEVAIEVASGEKEDDAYFSYVCSMDEGDSIFDGEKVWQKTNPGLPDIPTTRFIRQQVTRAQNNPTALAQVRRFIGCEWVSDKAMWFTTESWKRKAEGRISEQSERLGRRTWLGYTRRPSAAVHALAIVWEGTDDHPLEVLLRVWVSEKLRGEPVWSDLIRAGEVDVFADEVGVRADVGKVVSVLMADFEVAGIAVDSASRADLLDALRMGKMRGVEPEEGAVEDGEVLLRDHRLRFDGGRSGQHASLRMPESLGAVNRLIAARRLRVEPHPVIGPLLDVAAVAEDDARGRILSRRESGMDISPLLAMVMAVGYAAAAEGEDAFPDLSHLVRWQRSG